MRYEIKEALKEDVYRDIARIPEAHRIDKKGRQITEGAICKIKHEGYSIYSILRGNFKAKDAVVLLDERSRNRLNVKVGDSANFEIKTCSFWGKLCWALTATDPAYKLASRLAVISLVLGIIGLALGIFSLCQC